MSQSGVKTQSIVELAENLDARRSLGDTAVLPFRRTEQENWLMRIHAAASILFLLAALASSHAALAQDCAVQLTNNIGDTINVTVELQTDDPDENGEGESVLFESSGGEFSAVLTSYFAPIPYSYVATAPNETITG